jgi:DNA-binding NarL/FixJ family response regulator
MKIVIADDSSLLRDRICQLLRRLDDGMELYEAENGQLAMELVFAKNPDLVILDIRMPELTGIEVLNKIREMKMKTKVCMLTNYPFQQYKKKCIELGADYFFDKNMEFEKISEIVTW